MAIAGSGGWIPSVRVSICRRTLKLHPPIHNVPSTVVWMPELAAAHFVDDPDAFIYVPTSEGGGVIYLSELLREMGLTGPREQDEWKGG